MRFLLAPVAALALLSPPAFAASINGVFNTGVSDEPGAENSTLNLAFAACEATPEETCATIVAINDPAPDAKDILPDGSPLLGFTMITSLVDRGDGKFRKGRINAVDESINKGKMKWYDLKVDLLDNGDLKLRGCLGFICPRTMIWTRVDAAAE